MKINLQIENNIFSLGHRALASALSEITDIPENKELFDQLASHPSTFVKREVACKENLGKRTFETLVCSADSDIVLSLLRGKGVSRHLNEKHLKALIASNNYEVLEYLACQIEDFDISSNSEEGLFFINHADPGIRLTLARNTQAPKTMLRQLTKDEDPDVQSEAIDSLAIGDRLFK